MPETNASGWMIYYETHGDPAAPPLLMTLGLSHRLAHWGGLPSMLAKRLFVVTFDCRGMGVSERRDEPYSVADETEDMAAVMTAAGLDAAAIYGRSRGGMLAQEFALRYPDQVTALVLSGTHFGGSDVLPATQRVNAAMQLKPEMTREQIFATQNEAMAAPGWKERDPEAFAYCLATDLEAPPRRFAVDRQRGAIAAWSSRDRLAAITVSTLVLCGADDGMVPPENGRNLASRINGARLELIPQCGHLPMLEKPQTVARLVFEHLGV
ncbi:MAG: alpha/beta fold hydrolase [Anaerolineaceae bacterium]